MRDETVAQVGTKFSHNVMKRLAEHFAKEADYDPDVVEQVHNGVMTKALKDFPPDDVS